MERIGDVPGADSLKLVFSTGSSNEAPIAVQLTHTDVPVLEKAAVELAATLREFTGVKDVDDGLSLGKQQIDLELTPEARALGLTETDVARQVRWRFLRRRNRMGAFSEPLRLSSPGSKLRAWPCACRCC